MSLSDPIGDMIARVKNAQDRNHKKVELTSSNFKIRIADILKNEGFIKEFNVNKEDLFASVLTLKSLIKPSFFRISAILTLKLEEGNSTFL